MDCVDTEQHSEHGRCEQGQSVARGAPRGSKGRLWLALGGTLIVLAAAAWATHRSWLPHVQAALAGATPAADAQQPADGDETAACDGGADAPALELSAQGRKNIGLTLVTIALTDFERTIPMPATVVERPGQTRIVVSAPMTGIVTKIYRIRGEAVTPKTELFDLRVTHEDLVEKQSSFLRALEELDIVKKEVARLETVTASGAIAGARLLERQYEQHKLEASIRAERQALQLHGLSDDQIRQIDDERLLMQHLTILAPGLNGHAASNSHEQLLQVAELPVNVGEYVAVGVRLATLTDHCMLYVEGKAFEQDADALNRVANDGTEITALIEGNSSSLGSNAVRQVKGLRILHVENEVERNSRALKFYALLPNELVRNELVDGGKRFIGWRYKPGQRVEVLVPVERWRRRIVLPVEAVIEEGPERYVFRETQGKFERRQVHVEYRDQRFAVIENDGTLFPGDKVAARGAYQIHLALKNKADGGTDPHAGHHH